MPTGTRTSFGQYNSPEPFENLALIHQHTGEELKVVDHEPPLAVLDQEDLFAQGIDTSALVPGAQKVDALGSCTANATTVAVSNLGFGLYQEYLRALGQDSYENEADLFANTLWGEQAAIVFYHRCTDQTGTPDQEWPPTDCGSSGPYIVEELKTLKVISGQQIASGAQNLVSLLQTSGVCEGGPFLNAWEEVTGSEAVVDGNGSAATLEDQIRQGVAGGHETYISAIEKLTLSATGQVEPEKTILRVRNSWSPSWGDHGSFRIHLSTLVALGSYFDFRALVA